MGTTDEIPPGSRRIVPVGSPSGIGVFNVGGTYFALKNVCPHQGGPLCRGTVTGTTEARFVDDDYPEVEWILDGQILRCPWHKWEFDIATGRTIFESRLRVSTYPVTVELSQAEKERLLAGVETYPVTVEGGLVVLDLRPRARTRKRG